VELLYIGEVSLRNSLGARVVIVVFYRYKVPHFGEPVNNNQYCVVAKHTAKQQTGDGIYSKVLLASF